MRKRNKVGHKKGKRQVRAGGKLSLTAHSRHADSLTLYSQFNHLLKHFDKYKEANEKLQERMEDVEIHVNLLTRLLTTICIEKLGMRIGVLKRLLKRIEKEAIRDSQILHLESLYNLPHHPEKKSTLSPHPPKTDPWEEIS